MISILVRFILNNTNGDRSEYAWLDGSKEKGKKMKHKLYKAAMIVLPLFVGSGATLEVISFFSGHDININPIISMLLAIVGMGVGIANLWKLIQETEQ